MSYMLNAILRKKNDSLTIDPKSYSTLIKFLEKETRNPHVASALISIARKNAISNGQQIISIEDAIDTIRRDEGGLIDILNNELVIAKISGGGGLRGLFYCGEQEVLPLLFHLNFGVSIGAVAASYFDLRKLVQLYGTRYAHGIDISTKGFSKVAWELADALKGEGWVDSLPYIGDARRFYRGVVGEAFLVKEPIMDVIAKLFGDLKMRAFYKLRLMVANFSNADKMVITSDKEHQLTPVVKAMEATTAFPIVFDPLRKEGYILVDGGLNVTPIRLAAEEGADFIYVTLLNLYVPKKEDIDGHGPLGTARFAYRMYEILQRDASSEAIIHLTGKEPNYVREFGDPNGRILLSAEDLSGFDPFALKENHQELPKIGTQSTYKASNKLNTKYVHPEYSPQHFIERLRLELILRRPINLSA